MHPSLSLPSAGKSQVSGGVGSGKGPGPCQGLDDELDGHELLDEPPLEDEELSELLDDEDPVELLEEPPPEEELEYELDEEELSEPLEDELLVEGELLEDDDPDEELLELEKLLLLLELIDRLLHHAEGLVRSQCQGVKERCQAIKLMGGAFFRKIAF
ncbi:hypothetical protein [Allorhodopirellula solitaria]|uniref:Uncharacterized protein n=1 Tax=Allorhodopirellula solitaria TaxID=2527987 RepID=A0A5C5X111_9BACT|nr:hypothetical protein [Allorhodopirellula solitaria]TWT55981.1 hypothetical protein CA85_46890 [Allorhodopirellula solitaria]